MIHVWGRRNSVNVQKVLWALAELQLPHTREAAGGSFGGNREPGYLRMNPMGLVPVIRDGDVTMFESNAIVRYLSARYAPGVLRPQDHRQLAMAEQWMDWQQNSFGSPVMVIFFNTVRQSAAKRNAAAVAEAEQKAAEALAIADEHLARHEWFAGSRFSFGDIVMGCLMWRYLGLECSKPAVPHVGRWMDAISDRQAFRQSVMDIPRASSPAEWSRIEKQFG